MYSDNNQFQPEKEENENYNQIDYDNNNFNIKLEEQDEYYSNPIHNSNNTPINFPSSTTSTYFQLPPINLPYYSINQEYYNVLPQFQSDQTYFNQSNLPTSTNQFVPLPPLPPVNTTYHFNPIHQQPLHLSIPPLTSHQHYESEMTSPITPSPSSSIPSTPSPFTTTPNFNFTSTSNNNENKSSSSSNSTQILKIMPYRAGVTPFVTKLYWILQNPNEFSNCIKWESYFNYQDEENGEEWYFIINLNSKQFLNEILPNLFLHSNITSFCRQLQVYNFTRLSSDKISTELIESNSDWRAFNHKYLKPNQEKNLMLLKPRQSKARMKKKETKEKEKKNVK